MKAQKYFISYTGADQKWADWIAWELQKAGHSTVHQAWSFHPGANFVDAMRNALEHSDWTIAICSDAYFKSSWCTTEWTATLADASLIPVRIADCQIPKILKQIIFINLVGLDESSARISLLQGLRKDDLIPYIAPEFPAGSSTYAPFPGHLPDIFDVPGTRNATFVGREDVLDALHSQLRSSRRVSLVAISGLGGIGKSAVALEFTYRFASEYRLIWWLRSEGSATLVADYVRLAQKLGLHSGDTQNLNEVIGSVRTWLDRNEGWLLVMDNAVDATSLEGFLPSGNSGHVIVTSRNQIWRSISVPISIMKFSRQESLSLLQMRIGLRPESELDALAEALGDLPLALVLAATYIEATAISTPKYLNLVKSHLSEMLGPLETTWLLSLIRVGDENPKAIELLNLIAFFSPDRIPRELLDTDCESLLTDSSIASLRRFSFVEADEKFVSVHRLVQEITRRRLTTPLQESFLEAAISLLFSAFPANVEYASWAFCAELAPHVLQTLEWAETMSVGQEQVWWLLNQLGIYEQDIGNMAVAEQQFRRSLQSAEKVVGSEEDPLLIPILNNLGHVLGRQFRYGEALQSIKRALRIADKNPSQTFPNKGAWVNNIAVILAETLDFAGALPYSLQAMDLARAQFGEEHFSVAVCANTLGVVLAGLHRLSEAETYAIQAVTLGRILFKGGDNPRLARWIASLAKILAAKGDFGLAIERLNEALEMSKNTCGLDHPSTKRISESLSAIESRRSDESWKEEFRRGVPGQLPQLPNSQSGLRIDTSPLPPNTNPEAHSS